MLTSSNNSSAELQHCNCVMNTDMVLQLLSVVVNNSKN